MNERRLLETGIRAIGVYFLLTGLSGIVLAVVRSLSSPMQVVVVTSASTSIVTPIVAVLLLRSSGRLAAAVAEGSSTEASRLATPGDWDRWILATVVAIAILTSSSRIFVQMMFYSIYFSTLPAARYLGPFTTVIIALFSLLALSAIGLAIIKTPTLFSGRRRHAHQ